MSQGFSGFDFRNFDFNGFGGNNQFGQGEGGIGDLQSLFQSLGQGGVNFNDLFKQGTHTAGQRPVNITGIQRQGVGDNSPFFVSPQVALNELEAAQPGILEQMAQALMGDMFRQQGAADRQFERNEGAIQGINQVLGGVRGRLEGQASESAMNLNRLGELFLGRAENTLHSFDEASALLTKDISGQVRGATQAASRVVSNERRVEREFQSSEAALAVNVTLGIARDGRQRKELINSGVMADGTLMTPEQKAQLSQNLDRDMRENSFSVRAELAQAYNIGKATLGGRVSTALANLASVKLSGAGLLANLGTALSGQRVQLEGLRNQTAEFAGNLNIMGEQMRASAQLASVQFEIQGRMGIAQLISNNVEGVVSMFAGLSSLFAAFSAPGADRIRAVNFGRFA